MASSTPQRVLSAEELLAIINTDGIADSGVTARKYGWDHQDLVGKLKKLSSHNMITMEFSKDSDKQRYSFTEEALRVIKDGSPEFRCLQAVPPEGILKTDLDALIGPDIKIAWTNCMKNKWLDFDKASKKVLRKVKGQVEDSTRKLLTSLKETEDANLPPSISPADITSLKSRQLVSPYVLKTYVVAKGPDFALSFVKPVTDLTPEMISSGSWKTSRFKEFNFDSLGVRPQGGHLHPLMKMRTEFRQIFLEMGFEEMPTNKYVESSFWNYDSLFQPQQHPVRDAHDTFFVSDPKYAKISQEDYLKKVHEVHEKGGYGSIGWRYDWKVEEAQKNVLRTHTTAVSAQMLYEIGLQKEFKPRKLFSIDKVYRNESLDATHLAEFFQIEGVIVDYDLTLGNLIGVLHEFYSKLGITQLRFKPAYNPYTEPSMEIFSYHEGLKKWVEVGNSGMFRPEMLRPMNLPAGVSAIAWGLSLERPTMIKYGIKNIRDLVGSKVDMKFIRDNHIVRF